MSIFGDILLQFNRDVYYEKFSKTPKSKNLRKAPGGWGFFPLIFFSQATKKSPTPLGLFASLLTNEDFL